MKCQKQLVEHGGTENRGVVKKPTCNDWDRFCNVSTVLHFTKKSLLHIHPYPCESIHIHIFYIIYIYIYFSLQTWRIIWVPYLNSIVNECFRCSHPANSCPFPRPLVQVWTLLPRQDETLSIPKQRDRGPVLMRKDQL